MIIPCMELFVVIFQLSHDFQTLWEPCLLDSYVFRSKRIWRENLILLHTNKKGEDMPVHLQSLISTFVSRYLEGIIAECSHAAYKTSKILVAEHASRL